MMYAACLRISLLVFAILAWSFDASAQLEKFQLDVHEGNLTMWAENVPLKKVLAQIEKHSDIRVHLMEDQQEVISTAFMAIPLDRGLELLLHDFNHSLVYREMDEGGPVVVSAVFVYSRMRNSTRQVEYRKERKAVEPQPIQAPGRQSTGGRVPLYNTVPGDDDPMASMQGIDPLMRYATTQSPGHLQENVTSLLPAPFKAPDSMDMVVTRP